ncbi:MAG TPA: DoxX family protein [Roseiarcus sp.]|nr:DoxX family protein [Roseiarcus sp.]
MMVTQPASRSRPFAAFADFTQSVFSLVPMSLTMLALRLALSVPFWRSGQTKWDGFLTLSFGAKALFAEEYKLHIFGSEYPYPAPEAMATLSALGETCLPVLLVLGLGARYAALGIFAMTAIIQLTVPDGWANFHLPWASMALAIITFGPGRIALDYLLGIDRPRGVC